MPEKREKIRYHDNLTGPEYDPDGMLSDNWNPDADYDVREYVDAHFRVNTPAYRPPNYIFEEKDKQRFNEEAAGVFARLGWTTESEAYSGACTTVRKGKSSLYLHPQDFSGTVLKSEVKTIAEALRQHETFSLLRVDLYETICDITDEAYYAYLDTQTDRIREEILKSSVTTRRNKFYHDYDVANHVAGKVRLNRIGDDDGKHFGTGKTARYILGVIDRLVEQGELASAQSRNGSRMIRALNKTERRAGKSKSMAA